MTSLAAGILAAAWLTTALLGGAVLALLAKRIHPALRFGRLWLVYSALLGVTVAAVMAIGWW